MTTMPPRLPRLLVLSVLLSVLALGAHAAIDTHNATAAHVGGGDLAIFVSDDRARALAIQFRKRRLRSGVGQQMADLFSAYFMRSPGRRDRGLRPCAEARRAEGCSGRPALCRPAHGVLVPLPLRPRMELYSRYILH